MKLLLIGNSGGRISTNQPSLLFRPLLKMSSPLHPLLHSGQAFGLACIPYFPPHTNPPTRLEAFILPPPAIPPISADTPAKIITMRATLTPASLKINFYKTYTVLKLYKNTSL